MARLGVAEANPHLARWAARRPNMIKLLPSMIELLLEILNLPTPGNPQSAQGLSSPIEQGAAANVRRRGMAYLIDDMRRFVSFVN
jgi:hypothetical protein